MLRSIFVYWWTTKFRKPIILRIWLASSGALIPSACNYQKLSPLETGIPSLLVRIRWFAKSIARSDHLEKSRVLTGEVGTEARRVGLELFPRAADAPLDALDIIDYDVVHRL